MKKLFLFFSFCVLAISVYAQPTTSGKKELTLEDAILRRFSDLYPDRLMGLQWVKGTGQISYFSPKRDQLIISLPNTRKPDIRVELFQLNESLDLALKAFPSVSWLDANTFYLSYKGAYYKYDLSARKGERLLSHPENAANKDYHASANALAYTIDNNLYMADAKREQRSITNFSDGNVVSGQAIARYEFGIAKGTFWSNDGKKLAFYEKDESDVADYPLLNSGPTPGTLESVKYPMAGQKSEYARVGVYDLESGRTLYLKVDGPKDQFLTNLAWGPAGQYVYLAVVNRDQNQMALNQYDANSGNYVKTLFEEKHDKYVEPEKPLWFLPDNANEFLWMSERDGFMHVYRYNLAGEMLGQVTSGNWTVLDILGLSNSGKNLIVHGTDETGLNQYAYSVALDGGKKVKKLSEKSGVHNYKLNEDGILLLDVYSSVKTPYVADIINTRGKKVSTLLASPNPMRDYKVGTAELLEVKAADGTVLNARMIKPSNFNPRERYPVLVYVYGGPHAQMVSNRWLAAAPPWMYYWAEKGYIVFTLDNRGSANRGFEFENIVHRQMGTVEIEDQLAGVEYLKSLNYVDATRMGVHGWSYGGFMTSSLMLRSPETFKVGVAGGPVTDWKYYEIMYGERYMDRPEENPEGYRKASLLTHAENLQGDLLLIHGAMDDIVVMQHNYALLNEFIRLGKMVDFFVYPSHKHNVRGRDRVHLMNKVLGY
ncbi:MAG: DPP IV N-terminal domain-containing protein, partial [Bacteroidota bacterium]